MARSRGVRMVRTRPLERTMSCKEETKQSVSSAFQEDWINYGKSFGRDGEEEETETNPGGDQRRSLARIDCDGTIELPPRHLEQPERDTA